MRNVTEEEAEAEYEKYSSRVTENDVGDILSKEQDVMGKARGPLAKFVEDIKLLFAVVRDYANGTYRELPWTTIAGIIAALIYIFSPIDLVPDFIPVAGLADDAAVLAACLACVHADLRKYKAWKNDFTTENGGGTRQALGQNHGK